MNFYPQERVALFIDGANLYATARALGFDIDYKRLLELFSGKINLVRAFYYTALIEDQDYSPIRPLVDWLDYNGYTMVTKPTKEFTDATGRRKIKGNMDIELAIDVMEMAQHLDHIVLFSGDGDFRRLVEAVQRKGVRVTVVSTVRSQPAMIADEQRRHCVGMALVLSAVLMSTRTVLPPGLSRRGLVGGVAIGAVAGFGLLWPTIAVEGSDSFDACRKDQAVAERALGDLAEGIP